MAESYDETEHNVNPSINDVEIEDLEKIKGDAIGSTMYSERWVLKTLIKFTQLSTAEPDDELEADLCALWDMTVEMDVVDFLMGHDILSIISCALKSFGQPSHSRLKEVTVGILGNLCCSQPVRAELSVRNELVSQLIDFFDEHDPPVLTQLVRLCHSCAWDLVRRDDISPSHWLQTSIASGQLPDHLAFILKSSTNEELICAVLEFLNTMCCADNDTDFSNAFCTAEMVAGLLDCWRELFRSWSPEDDFPNRNMSKAASHWTTTLLAFAGQEKGRELIVDNGTDVGHILTSIAVRPLDSIDAMLIPTVQVLEVLIHVYFNGTVLKRLLEVLNALYQNQGESSFSQLDGLSEALQDTIESYCTNVLLAVSRPTLNYILAECPENHVLLFWKTISDRQTEESSERTI